MSSFRSALEEWKSEDLEDRSAGQIADDLIELEQVDGWLQAERARRIASFESKRGQDLEGHASATAFLKHRCAMSGGRAHQAVVLAHSIRQLPTVFVALGHGRMSIDQVRVLIAAGERLGEALSRDQGGLVGAVEGLSVADTRRVLAYWKDAVDGPGAELESEEMFQERYLHASRTMGGMVKVDGMFDPETGDLLLTALDAATAPPGPDGVRSARQRRADALSDICRSFLDSGEAAGTEKPHLMVLADLDALQGHAGGTHETASREVLTPETVRRISCDCTISRVIFGPEGEPVDIGRASRTIPPSMRRAVIARDRHCRWDGCDRPARWTDVHHIWHWADGGPTALWNLKLLCRYHHTRTHHDASLARPDG